MKSKVSCLLVGVFLIADPVVAQAAQFGDFEYESSGTEVTITGYTGAGGAVTIPDSILGLPVTSIGAGAFGECTGLTSIEMEAFWTCTNLTSVRFEGNAPSLVGSDVFAGDDNATVYYLPGTTGWGPTFGGRPTAVWTQLVDIPDPANRPECEPREIPVRIADPATN